MLPIRDSFFKDTHGLTCVSCKKMKSYSMQMERKAPFQNKYMLGHKTNLSKFNKTEIIPVIFSDYSGIKLKINKRGKT